jgi:hypothetical protein
MNSRLFRYSRRRARVGTRTFALECHRGVEGVRFFVRTKMTVYQRGLADFPLTAVLIVTDRGARMISLAKAIGDQRGRVLFTTLELMREHSFLAPVFYSEPGRWGVSLIEKPLFPESLDDKRVCEEQ